MKIRLGSTLAGTLALAYTRIEGCRVTASPPELIQETDELGAVLRQRFEGLEISKVPGIQTARRLYRAIGVDPTHIRPSSESLLRRVRKGEPLYRINSAVDAGNYFSLESLLPIGLYDAARIQGDATAEVGAPGSGYEGIRKDRVNVAGRVALHDELGPFGNPTGDSLRTCIRESTESLLLTIFAPADLPRPELEAALLRAEALQIRWSGGHRVEHGFLA